MKDVLRLPVFRRYFIGQACSTFGDNAMFLALAIWTKQLTGSSGAAGALFFAFLLPATVLSPALGYLADRVRRRPLMIVTNGVSAAAVLPLLAVHREEQVWILYVVAVMLGVSTGILGAARAGLLKDIVAEDQLAGANAALRTATDGLRLVSPLIGAGLFAAAGGGAVAAVDALTFLLAVASLVTIRVAESPPDAGEEPLWRSLGAGFRHILGSAALRRLVGVVAIACLAVGFDETLIIAVVDQGLHRAPSFLGVLVSIGGAGAILGGLTATGVIRRLGELHAVGVGLALFGAGTLMEMTGQLGVVVVGQVVLWVGVPWLAVAFMTLLQRTTPAHLQGRVAAAADVAIGGCQTVSIAVGAALVTVVDYRLLLLVVAATLLGCAAATWRPLRTEVTAVAAATTS
jgi:MFS family permease